MGKYSQVGGKVIIQEDKEAYQKVLWEIYTLVWRCSEDRRFKEKKREKYKIQEEKWFVKNKHK